jgi:hypothetical protein
MDRGARFRVNRPKIVSETIDDEVIILNLDRGHYFSLRQSGAEIWHSLDHGASADEIIAHMTGRYIGDGRDIGSAVLRLISECQAEELIVPLGAPTSVGDQGAPRSAPTEPRTDFIAPELTKFTDMEDLLLLDPIHEVDETGWPHQQAPAGHADGAVGPGTGEIGRGA